MLVANGHYPPAVELVRTDHIIHLIVREPDNRLTGRFVALTIAEKVD